jgi:hypothetical protein
MENLPKLAFVPVYESEIFRKESPSGYATTETEEMENELIRLGFDVHNINLSLNENLLFIVESTAKHDQRISLMSNELMDSYDYLLYVSYHSEYRNPTDTESYKINLVIRMRYLGDYSNLPNGDTGDESIKDLYDSHTTKRKNLDDIGQLTRSQLKEESMEVFIDYFINFVNNYVKEIVNYNYILEGKEPVC